MRTLVALLLSLAVPAAGFGALHHETTEVHAFCAEHGHVVHESAAETAGWNAADAEHEGCSFEQIAPLSVSAESTPEVTSVPTTLALARAPLAPPARGGALAILAYAPKTSPPLS